MRIPTVDEKLAQIRGLQTPYIISLCGIKLTILKNVYPTSEVSELIVEALDQPEIGLKTREKVTDAVVEKMLDFGTGTGFLAIQAAKRGADVIAIDANPEALKCAKINTKAHNLENKIELRLSKNLSGIKPEEKFDIIVAGMPWDNAVPLDELEMSMYDEEFQMKRSLFQDGFQHLNEGGRIFLTYAESVQGRYPIEKFTDNWRFELVAKRLIKDEMHYAIMGTPVGRNDQSTEFLT